MEQREQGIAHYMDELDRIDRDLPGLPEERGSHLKERIGMLKAQMQKLGEIEPQMCAAADVQISLTDPARGRSQPTIVVPAWSAITCRPL